MKLTKKLLAMALAGVMLLTILTGCSSRKSGDRLVEEYMATFFSENSGDVPITHDVPEIKAVAENFDPSLLASNGIGFDANVIYKPTGSASDNLQKLKSALVNYKNCTNVYLYAMAVPEGLSELTQVTLLLYYSSYYTAYTNTAGGLPTLDSIKCASTLVKKGGKQYRLVVLIQVPAAS